MRWLQQVRMFLYSLVHRKDAETNLNAEFEAYLELEIESNLGKGMPPDQARFEALRQLGAAARFQEECRDQRGTAPLENVARDLNYALRMIRRTPLFSAVAIATLALGIGANTFIYTFIDNVLFRALPVQNPQELVALNWGSRSNSNMSYPNYEFLREHNSAFSNLVATRVNIVNLSLQPGHNFLVWGYEATGNYFQTLGIEPQLGRFFTPAEDNAPGAHPVIVLSDRYWRSHYAADRRVLGSTVNLNGYPFAIIGVAQPKFTGTELILSGDFWVPMSMELQIEPGNDWYHSRSSQNIWVMGRLKAGVTKAQAESSLNTLSERLGQLYPGVVDPRSQFHLSRPGLVGDTLRGPVTSFGMVLSGLAGAVLLLACINLAGMLLARGSDRQREVAIRLALGASRWRLLRQLMTESALLAAVGGAAGFAIAVWACSLFSSWRPDLGIPLDASLRPNFNVLCFSTAASVLATLAFGLMPALDAVRIDIVSRIKGDRVFHRFRRVHLRDLLLVGQIALSVVLVICSALVVRSLQHALSLKLGYDPERAVSISFDLRKTGYNDEESRRVAATVLEKAAAVPGFEAVGITSNMPLRVDHGNNNVFCRADRPVPPLSNRQGATTYNISPGYLRAAATQLLSGRDFNSRDRFGALPVVMVNQALVDRLYPQESPLGKRLRLGSDEADKGLEIVGVVETGKHEYIGEDPHPAVLLPIAQTGIGWTTLIARGLLPPTTAIDALRKVVLDVNPELAFSNVGSLKEQLALPLFPARMAAMVLSLFGLLALILSSVGLFAVVAYAVAKRTREIGIRMALGARSSQVLTSLFSRTIALCVAGISLGVVITLLTGRVLSSVLYGVSPHDPAAYASALIVMIGVCLVACYGPATRAIRTDSSQTLRAE